MTSDESREGRMERRLRSPSAGSLTSADVAAHHRRWLARLPLDAPTMAARGPDGNLYLDDDESFWRELLERRED